MTKGINLMGIQFNEWKIIEYYGKKHGRRYWLCECSCGKIKEVDQAELRRGGSRSCGHDNKKDLLGMIFGEWTVLHTSRIIPALYKHFWLCRCSCGIIREVAHGNLENGTSTSCGHINNTLPDISIGMKFGEWTIIGESIRKSKSKRWLCECSCGKKKYVAYISLLYGTSLSCGHTNNDGIEKGRKFGRLTIISFSGRNKNGNAKYLCSCECGKNKIITGSGLKDGSSISCGCYAREMTSERNSKKNLSMIYKSFNKYYWYFYDTHGNKINCKSSYEVLYWNYFLFQEKENIIYEPKTFILSPCSRYTPDFYFPEKEKWIEIKGTFNLNASSRGQKQKIDILSNSIDIDILYWKDLVSICSLKYKTIRSYFNNAKKMNIEIEDFLGQRIYLDNLL